MKANAPKKIYVQMSRYWYGIDSLFYPVRQHKNDIEYIRTDALQNVLTYIDSLQEESVSRTLTDVESAMQEVEEKSRAFTESHQGENTDTILAQMRGEEPVSKDLEEASIIHSEIVRNTSFIDEDFIAGAVWQKEQLMKDAISAELYSDGMFTPLIGVKDKEKLKGIKFGDKVKLIIIKDN